MSFQAGHACTSNAQVPIPGDDESNFDDVPASTLGDSVAFQEAAETAADVAEAEGQQLSHVGCTTLAILAVPVFRCTVHLISLDGVLVNKLILASLDQHEG